MDAFRPEISPNPRCERVRHWSLRCSADFNQRDLCLSRRLARRPVGHRRAFITFNVVSIAGYALVLLIPHWGAVIAGMFLFLSWTCFSLPATFSLVGASVAANR